MIKFFVASNKLSEPILVCKWEQPVTVDSDPDKPVTAWHDPRVMIGFREANLKWMAETRARMQASLRIVKGQKNQVDAIASPDGSKTPMARTLASQ